MRLHIFPIAAVTAISFAGEAQVSVNPATIPVAGKIDERFQAYNVEMLEITGGRFWKPYKDLQTASPAQPDINSSRSASQDVSISESLYQYRPPTDLRNSRLRTLAAALGPTYIRVSGTWANSTYFQDSDAPAPAKAPEGFGAVLTRKEWKSVIDFAKTVNAQIITSFATSAGTRNAEGAWMPDQARSFLSYTKSIGGKIAAAEFMNEPNFAAVSRGAPKGYDAAYYGRDVTAFRTFLKQTAPEILFLGPGSVGEGGPVATVVNTGKLGSEALSQATGPAYDVFSYHIYAAASQRCAGKNTTFGTTRAAALSAEWLSRPDSVTAYYKTLRDRYSPGKPLWVTEMASAACGGNPWASTFLDSFWYLDQHATLAQQGVQVTAYNTLASSDYGLLDETTYEPRPNYWASLLWRKLMGTTVLKPTSSPSQNVRLYAHCASNVPGAVTLLAINTDRNQSQTLSVSAPSQRYTMTAPKLEDTRVDLNGSQLKLDANDLIPQLAGISAPAGALALPPASITFLVVRNARNAACR